MGPKSSHFLANDLSFMIFFVNFVILVFHIPDYRGNFLSNPFFSKYTWKGHSVQMLTLRLTKYLILVSPFKNQRSSWIILLRYIFFVVSTGNPEDKSKRSCLPNTFIVPVPVRSFLSSTPFFRMSSRSSRY